MKKFIRVILIIFILLISSCYAKVNSYEVTDTYNFIANGAIPSEGYIEIFIGSANCTNYQSGKITISPKPSNYRFDDYGNRIARFNIGNLRATNYTVTVKRNVNVTELVTNINYAEAGTDAASVYLEPSEHIESDDINIVKKAKELTNGCNNDYEKVKKIYEFVNLNIEYNLSDSYRNKGALSALLTRKGVCEEYATLFVALCRTSGIPARVITGYRTEGLEEGKVYDSPQLYHAWVEVYFKGYGWIPSEITSEYYLNGKRDVYWKGFLNLDKPIYVVEGIYNNQNKEIVWRGVDLKNYTKKIELLSSSYYTDISSHWAEVAIENMSDKQIIKGYDDGSFKPQSNISRIEYIALLARTMDYTGKYYYSDVDVYYPTDFIINWSKTDYDVLMRHYAYYSKDYNNGAGYNTISYVFDNKLDMNRPITRGEVVALLSPFLTDKSYANYSFTDIENNKFKESIIKSYSNNMVNGYPDSTFRPDDYITRAEIATILNRYIK